MYETLDLQPLGQPRQQVQEEANRIERELYELSASSSILREYG